MVKKAIVASGFKITEVISGTAEGVDKLGEQWAEENGIPIREFPALWNALKQPGAIIKNNKWGKPYNANAGFYRNEQMAKYAEACIAIQSSEDTPGTSNMIKHAQTYKLKLFVYKEEKEDHEYDYVF